MLQIMTLYNYFPGRTKDVHEGFADEKTMILNSKLYYKLLISHNQKCLDFCFLNFSYVIS